MEVVAYRGLGSCSCGSWTRVLLTDGILWACEDVLDWNGTAEDAAQWASWVESEAAARASYDEGRDDW